MVQSEIDQQRHRLCTWCRHIGLISQSTGDRNDTRQRQERKHDFVLDNAWNYVRDVNRSGTVLIDMTDQTTNTNTTARAIGYAITALVLALIFGPLFLIGAYTFVTSLMSLGMAP